MTSTDTNTSPLRRATIEDVATAAGVSVATVSRALRGLPNVAQSTRQRVMDVAAQLAYQPDPAAARLAAGRTSTVTVAVPSLNGWYFSTVVAGAEAVCAEAGLEFQVIGITSAASRDRLVDDSQRIERRTDGLILVDVTISAEQADSLTRRGVSLATVGTHMSGHPSVAIDDMLVGRMAAEHLTGLGHRHIGLIGGVSDGPLAFDAPITRRRGFEAALHSTGLGLPDELVANGNFSIDGGREAMSALIAASNRPTAVFAMSDEMAFGALMALSEHALAPGVDVSIMGVDDHEFSKVVGLTTIRQPVEDHGAVAARRLIEAMAAATSGGPPLPPPVAHEPTVALVERSTTAPEAGRKFPHSA